MNQRPAQCINFKNNNIQIKKNRDESTFRLNKNRNASIQRLKLKRDVCINVKIKEEKIGIYAYKPPD